MEQRVVVVVVRGDQCGDGRSGVQSPVAGSGITGGGPLSQQVECYDTDADRHIGQRGLARTRRTLVVDRLGAIERVCALSGLRVGAGADLSSHRD